ncbi:MULTISPECIES: winged helix-turn-helix domain-containing protein [Arthrobacter]|uniref:ArsR family transcriptional regulator n=1 Tax=Arthrobacter terricola TaxID=2547396 RepID=A0A4R5K9D5_9MICC|nr:MULTISPECIES: winged helix-turn-helix domain-containing protein [Arthrobacter]MBT8163023.1 winged helix-turn-helix domain-containing protein [Arthrobacter sp. GN70]TDF91771.1 ArsR family transcriptional regulator [Arthrobacter terricola]
MTLEELTGSLAALASQHRLAIIAELRGGRLHVSELARRLGMSRALLYMHAAKLEAAGFIESSLELSVTGSSVKYMSLVDFELTVTPALIEAAAKQQPKEEQD